MFASDTTMSVRFQSKRHFLKVLALSLPLLALSTAPAAAQTGNARVRVVHASADAPQVNVWVDGAQAFQGLSFKDYTDYTPVPAGSHAFALQVASSGAVALQKTFDLAPGGTYTFYAVGLVAKGTLDIMGTGDDPTAPEGANTKVRIVHAASTAPAVDVYATAPYTVLATPLLTDVPFAVSSGYLTVPAGTYQARVTPTGTKTVAIDSGRLVLSGGTTRTIVAVDPAGENGTFSFLILHDAN
jgi:hypothetical protein